MRLEKLLIIFLKNPEKGKVKTRLAATMGDEKALRIYKKLMNHTLNTALQTDAVRQLWYSSYISSPEGYGDHAFETHLQIGQDLGERMNHALSEGFCHGYKKGVIIGSDCPGLSGEILDQAFLELDRVDCVIGPAEDGGYYLLGIKTQIPGLFTGIEWSTAQVFRQTVQKLEERNLSYSVLPVLKDIDTEKDAKQSGFEDEQ